MKEYLKVLRPLQWTKNLLIFIPYILNSQKDEHDLIKIFYTFILFSIFVSSTYIFNDIKDIDLDKHHPSKKYRPIASGNINIKTALKSGVAIFAIALGSAYLIKPILPIYFLIYSFATLIYTLKFKYIFLADTILISLMFVIRIFIGGIVSGIELTNYLILFIFFTSSLLSISKKVSIINTFGNEQNSFYVLLNKQNQLFSFKKLYLFFSVFSFGSLLFWFLDIYKNILNLFEQIMFSLNFVAYILFLYFIYKFSKFGKLEDFSAEIIKNKTLLTLSFIIILTFILGYF